MRWFTVLSLAFVFSSFRAEAGAPRIGEPAPGFTASTFEGEKFSLDDLRGEVVIVNFWATWCGPCKKEIPLLDRYAREHKGDGLRIVAVTTDADDIEPRSLKKLQERFGFALTRKFKGDYGLINGTLPSSYVIDRAGVLQHVQAGAFTEASLEEILAPLLAEEGASAASAKAQPESFRR